MNSAALRSGPGYHAGRSACAENALGGALFDPGFEGVQAAFHLARQVIELAHVSFERYQSRLQTRLHRGYPRFERIEATVVVEESYEDC